MTKREKRTLLAVAVLAAVGGVLFVLRFMGMRFSGIVLMGIAALLSVELAVDRLAGRSRVGWWCQLVFRSGCALVLIPLVMLEGCVIHEAQQPASEEPCKAVIVLGAGVNGTEPSLSLRTRLDAALTYLEGHPEIPVVLTGGLGYGEEITEARCMYEYLTARGIDGSRLILEEQAANTAENFALSRPLLEMAGVNPVTDPVAVVTHDFHMARSRLIAVRQGYVNPQGVPAKLPWLHLEINYYVRESFALVKTLIFD